MTTIGDILDIPDAVHQGDLVLRLTAGLKADRRRSTLEQYVVTPQLVQSFDQPLSLIGSAVTGNSSKGPICTAASAAARAISWPRWT